jgi:hypothetical protein
MGSFTSGGSFPMVNGPASVAVGDLNQDGLPDIAVGSFATNVSLLLGSGGGHFVAGPTQGSSVVFALAIADLNGDGKSELAIADSSSSKVRVLVNTTP